MEGSTIYVTKKFNSLLDLWCSLQDRTVNCGTYFLGQNCNVTGQKHFHSFKTSNIVWYLLHAFIYYLLLLLLV